MINKRIYFHTDGTNRKFPGKFKSFKNYNFNYQKKKNKEFITKQADLKNNQINQQQISNQNKYQKAKKKQNNFKTL